MNTYRIEVDRIERDGSIFTVVQHRQLKTYQISPWSRPSDEQSC